MNKLYRILQASRRRAREGHLGVARQLLEMAALGSLHGVGPRYYHIAGFWRRDLGWRDKTGQLGPRAYQRRLEEINPGAYRKLSQNKVSEKAIFALFGIPTARFFGRLHERVGLDVAGRPLCNAADLERLVRERRAARIVFKPAEGWGGKDVHIPAIAGEPALLFREPGQRRGRTVESYCADPLELHRGRDWIVEEYFEQHSVVAAINPASVNTVRIWVIDRGAKGYRILLAYLRIGRASMWVDNASSGGVVAPVDLRSGRLRAARDACLEHTVHARHPDHGAAIEGVGLPWWPDVKQLAKRALSVFPGLRFAGLDVAIGPAGPIVLEMNVVPDHDGAAFSDFPSATL